MEPFGPEPPSTSCSIDTSQPLNIYFIVDCDWQRVRSSLALPFLPFSGRGELLVLWTGSSSLEPIVNPPRGIGITQRESALQMIEEELRPRPCGQNNNIPGQTNNRISQIGNALRRVVDEQRRDGSLPFIVHMFTNRTDPYMDYDQIRASLAEIKSLQGNKDVTHVTYSGSSTQSSLFGRLQSERLITQNWPPGDTNDISNAVCSQLQTVLG